MSGGLTVQCPACGELNNKPAVVLDCGNMDQSRLYRTVRLMICECCGHAFNRLTQEDVDGLIWYYNHEYAPANLHAASIPGDRPGSADPLTMHRYSQLYDILSPHIDTSGNILDVGCAMGGFLEYLWTKGFRQISGVDMTETYVQRARQDKPFSIELGDAESLPFEDQSLDVVIMDQVMEHVIAPSNAFKEAGRVLKQNGILCLGVPDAARYGDFFFFYYYWLLLREHVHHFDIAHLNLLAEAEGFQMVAVHQTSHAVMSGRMVMPNLYALYRRKEAPRRSPGRSEGDMRLRHRMTEYVRQENARLEKVKATLSELADSSRPTYIWGIGREFLYLYESAGLKSCNIAGLIDMNDMKQATGSVGGMPITDAAILKKTGRDCVLLITAVAHRESIKAELKKLDFRGKVLDFPAPASDQES